MHINNFTIVDFQLLISVVDMFVAGTHTVCAGFQWTVVFLMEHPDVLEHMRKEIQRVVPFDRPVRMADRRKRTI